MNSHQRVTTEFLLVACLLGILALPASFAAGNRYASFLVSPNPNMTGAAECPFITYQAWDGCLWTAWIKDDQIIVSPAGNIFAAVRTKALEYLDADGKPWEAAFATGKFHHVPKGDAGSANSSDMIAYRSWDGRSFFARLLLPALPPPGMASGTTEHAGPRFSCEAGEVTDWELDLVWKPGPDQDCTYDEALAWISSLGKGWRRPTQLELRALFSRGEGGGLKGNMPAAFPKMGGTIVWAEENDAATAWYIGFIYGNGYTLGRDKKRFARVLAVRPR